MFEIGHFLSLFDLVNVLYYKRISEVNMKMCNYQVGDLLSLETRFGKIQLYVVIEELFGCTTSKKHSNRKNRSFATTLVYKVIKTDIFCP